MSSRMDTADRPETAVSGTRFTHCPFLLHCHRASIAAILLALIGCAQAAPWRLDAAERVVAISDVHGAYDGMLRTLQSAGVIDAEQSWAAGDTHLVITGDMVDRGADSRKVMDLVMKLEQQAAQSGGAVHLLLGNHEVMNLVGDLRYVARGEYAAFAEEEDAGERARWFEQFRAANTGVANEETLRSDFDNKAPPGFFAHRRAFRPDGHYGRWLLQKPLVLVIGDTAFVHGGLSPLIAELGLDGVNTRLRSELNSYLQAMVVLEEAGILSPTENFNYHAELLKPLQSNTELTAEVKAAIATIIELNESEIHGMEGPLWYRGNVACGALTENDKLDKVLAAIGARRVVIGHTPTVTRRVLQRLDGRVIEIDTGMLTSAYKGSGNALVMAGDSLTVVNESGATSDGPVQHPQSVAFGPATRTADELAAALATGELKSKATDETGRTVVTLSSEAGDLQAVFTKNPRGRGFVPELAAYRLDQLLALNMVPVTVPRELNGDAGSLQLLAPGTRNETQRAAGRLGAGAWCPLPDQWNLMYVFDVLVYNPGRQQREILYAPESWQLLLTGHEDAFAAKGTRPPWSAPIQLQLGKAWVNALQSLDDATLQAALGDVLDRKRLAALASRRDELLQLALTQ